MAKKKASTKKKTKKKAARKKRGPAAGSRGLTPAEVLEGGPPAAIQELSDQVAADGGTVLAAYRDPLGGCWQLMTVLRDRFLLDAIPLHKVSGQPFKIREIEAAIENLLGNKGLKS